MAFRSIYYDPRWQDILIEQIKNPFTEAMEKLIDPKAGLGEKFRALKSLKKLVPVIEGLPEPDPVNVQQANNQILVYIAEEFFCEFHLFLLRRTAKAAVKFGIIVYDTDFYRPFIDWWVWEIKKDRSLEDISEEFFGRLELPSRTGILQSIVKAFNRLYRNPLTGRYIKWWLGEIRPNYWKPLGPLQPDPHYFKNLSGGN